MKAKTKSKTKSKVVQLVEVRTKVVLGIMLVAAYMLTASFALAPFNGVNKNNKVGHEITSISVLKTSSVPSYDDWGISELPRYWESDNGDSYVAGYIVDRETGTKYGYDYCTDYSNEGTSLVEISIDGDFAMNRLVTCDEGCYNGRCVYEYEVCPEQYECTSDASRALINNDCYWSDYEVRDGNDWTCSGGEFYYIGEEIPEEPAFFSVCDFNNDGVRNLVDISLFSACQNTFDANNDGIHNLIDISLYAKNNQDDLWCMSNMFECYSISTSSLPTSSWGL